jgi:16S rRNA processing protein RimM
VGQRVSDRVAVGRVGKPHGIEGAFFVEEPSDDPARYAKGATLFVDGEPAEVVSSKQARGRPVIRLDREVPRGARLEVDRDALPPPKEDEYYVFQLVGLAVERADGTPLGRVENVDPGVANDVLRLDSGLLLPLVEACVRTVDLEAGRIVVAPGFDEAD